MLNLEDFRASKRPVIDLGAEFGDDSLAGVSGLVYAAGCYIENRADGQYFLLIDRSDWLSTDLSQLEEYLYNQHYVYEAAGDDVVVAATPDVDKITVRRIHRLTGETWQVVQFKVAGLAKGETVLATLCGGNMGKVLAATVAKQAASMAMIDVIEMEA